MDTVGLHISSYPLYLCIYSFFLLEKNQYLTSLILGKYKRLILTVSCRICYAFWTLKMSVNNSSNYWDYIWISFWQALNYFSVINTLLLSSPGIIAMIGVIIFGVQFRGPTVYRPYGWSFQMMIAALILLVINGILTIVLNSFILNQLKTVKKSDLNRPLQAGFWSGSISETVDGLAASDTSDDNAIRTTGVWCHKFYWPLSWLYINNE